MRVSTLVWSFVSFHPELHHPFTSFSAFLAPFATHVIGNSCCDVSLWVAQCFLFPTLTFSPFTFSFQNKQARMSKRHFSVGQQTRALLGKNFLRKWRMKRETLSVWFRVYVISYLKEDRVLPCAQTLYLFSLLFHRYSVSN